MSKANYPLIADQFLTGSAPNKNTNWTGWNKFLLLGLVRMDSVELGLDDKKHFGLDSDTGLMTKVIKERNIYNTRHYPRKIKYFSHYVYTTFLLFHKIYHKLGSLKQLKYIISWFP